LSQILATYNREGIYWEGANKYEVAGDQPNDREGLWTDAAWKSLVIIAQAWCDECNKLIEQEEPIEIKIIRVERTPA
jgi:hypothetical protein